MPKYYCDYCDIFLTHDSASVRKAHNSGWKHALCVRNYYSDMSTERSQEIQDKLVAAYVARGQQAPPGLSTFGPITSHSSYVPGMNIPDGVRVNPPMSVIPNQGPYMRVMPPMDHSGPGFPSQQPPPHAMHPHAGSFAPPPPGSFPPPPRPNGSGFPPAPGSFPPPPQGFRLPPSNPAPGLGGGGGPPSLVLSATSEGIVAEGY